MMSWIKKHQVTLTVAWISASLCADAVWQGVHRFLEVFPGIRAKLGF